MANNNNNNNAAAENVEVEDITNLNLYQRYKKSGRMPEEDIDQLSKQQLRSGDLNLSSNNLSTLPNNFSKLSTLQPPLQTLELSLNPKLGDDLPLFNSTTIIQICSLSQHLTHLHLYGCGLQSPLPSQLTTLQQLTHLDLGYNLQLKIFPTIVQHLPQLEYLNLSNIGMSGDDAIPSTTLATLTNLTWLDLGYNELTRIPPTICNLTKLKTLYIQDNKLSTIPLEIGNLPLLKDFLCYGNPFVSPLDSVRTGDYEKHSSRTLSLLRECLRGTTQYNQLKLIFLGNGKEGKVKDRENMKI